MQRALAWGLTAGAVVWLALLLAAPVTPAAGFAYALADGICHQRPERSFHLAGAPLPVCARCFGLYLSGAIGALAAFMGPRGRARRADAPTARLIFGIAALPTMFTVGVEWIGLTPLSNAIRAAAALPLGAAAGWVFVRMLLAEAAPAAAVSNG